MHTTHRETVCVQYLDHLAIRETPEQVSGGLGGHIQVWVWALHTCSVGEISWLVSSAQ